ncbi:hypothetical protein [Propionigenium maris]|nr:hypothetical protein [Propionigenium maris]
MNRYNQSGEQVKKISKKKSLSISKRLEKIRQEKLKEMIIIAL